MPARTDVSHNGTWRETKTLSVYHSGSWRDVKEASVYHSGSWRKVFPANKPPVGIRVTPTPSSILTQESSTIVIQLIDEDGNSSAEARSISVSTNTGGSGSFTTAPTSTNSAGTAEFTFNSNNNAGTASITVTSSGLTDGTNSITISLRTGLLPALGTFVSTDWGFYFPHTNVDTANYSYASSEINAPNDNAALFYGTQFYDNPVHIFMWTANSVAPVASQDGSNVYCTSGTWGGGNGSGGVSVTIRTTRAGYTTRSSVVTGGVSLSTFTLGFSYQWVYWNGSAFVPWGDPMTTGTKAKGSFYYSNIQGNSMICDVTCYRDYGGGLHSGHKLIGSNKITGT